MNDEVAVARPPRISRHLLVAGSAWASRIVTALVQLASVRILMDSLGLENYAVFALLTALAGWLTLADLGIGVSVQNHISESRAKGQRYDELIAASGMIAVMLLLVTVIALYFISPYVAPQFLTHFTFMNEGEKVQLFFLAGAFSIGFGVGSIAYKVWYAEQRGHLSNIVPTIASIVGFVGLLMSSQAPVEERLFLSLVAFLAPTAFLPLAALAMQQFRCDYKHSERKLSDTVRIIMKRGLHFWFFAVMAAGVLQIDYIVMSQFLDAHDIAAYNLSTKIFGLAFFFYYAILLALWPIFAEALANRKWEAVRRHVRKYLIFGLIFMFVCTTLLMWLMPVAVEILAPKETIIIPVGFILLLGIYQMIRVWTDTFSMVLQSMNDLKPFWIYVPIQAILSIALQWALVPVYGINGIILGLIASFAFTVIWALPLAVWKHYQLHQQART